MKIQVNLYWNGRQSIPTIHNVDAPSLQKAADTVLDEQGFTRGACYSQATRKRSKKKSWNVLEGHTSGIFVPFTAFTV